ncbi:MAG: hypothetical protein HDR36_09885 [Treponema sp.]|nr:hypothetical protein [Treponema sp.]MBD5441276.1 hypothetical protein [Treponema sp.]
MIDFSQIAENVQDFLSERKKAVLISAILVLFFCAALIVLSFAPQSKKNEIEPYRAEPFIADQELLLPQGPSVPQSYSVGRQNAEGWNENEIERWLTRPDADAVEKLSSANDAMISEITGAAP